MSMFFDMFIVAMLTPITNYVNNKRCDILGRYSEEARLEYSQNWVQQTKLYGDFVKKYLDFDTSDD